MIFRKFEFRLFFKITLLGVSIFAIIEMYHSGQYIFEMYLFPVFLILLFNLYTDQRRILTELNEFVDAIQYRDFSRFFNEKTSHSNIRKLRKGFNAVNETFRLISGERETQYQYLQKILELIDTGIICYNNDTGLVDWINESAKNLLRIPYLKSINTLETRHPGLLEVLEKVQPGRPCIYEVQEKQAKILVSATTFRTSNRMLRLLAFQNLGATLDETEADAWQKLLGVLTHEIMNSVAPISSLASSLEKAIEHDTSIDSGNKTWGDVKLGIFTIRKRSEGLLKFSKVYRNLSKINSLNLELLDVKGILNNLFILLNPTFVAKGILFEIVLPGTEVFIEADPGLIEQLLINLCLNAIDAVKNANNPSVSVSAFKDDDQNSGRTTIKIKDNGMGMEDEVLNKVFIPFFTTKKNGNGIGLSLCKQIMVLHKGNIYVQSVQGKGTTFILRF